jgi:hypothetical protein
MGITVPVLAGTSGGGKARIFCAEDIRGSLKGDGFTYF